MVKAKSYLVAAASLATARPTQLFRGKRQGRCSASALGGGGDRKAISLRAGLHFRQRHLGALGAPEAREEWGPGCSRPLRPLPSPVRGEAHPGNATLGSPDCGPPQGGLRRQRARAGRPRSPPVRRPPAACVRRVRGRAGGRPLSDSAPAPSARGQRRPAPRARPDWGRGGPGGAGKVRAGGYLRGGGGAGRVAGGDGALRPVAGPRSPVGLGKGPPLGVSLVATESFPLPARASGCAAPSSPTFPFPAAAGPADSRCTFTVGPRGARPVPLGAGKGAKAFAVRGDGPAGPEGASVRRRPSGPERQGRRLYVGLSHPEKPGEDEREPGGADAGKTLCPLSTHVTKSQKYAASGAGPLAEMTQAPAAAEQPQ
ncbi:collagen alpha-2(I) chain-like [Vulpes lagopus]|uniref:collagen alpha-2(I) chain-like n=1 Tax=Vulpes lagopus TaxID=494514 RepID=UPI001BC9256C|nr:collagen alpha-2(I) chain-like [Vulpes lagopus]